MKILTLLTDYGLDDWYVASVKAVLYSYVKKLKIVDITHNVPSFQIEKASYILYSSYHYFPEGTTHLVIVDPQVGTKRDFLFFKYKFHYFFVPDNGLITFFYKKNLDLRKIIFPEKLIKNSSFTFHGRDLFAPIVGRFLKGEKIEMEKKDDPVLFNYKKPVKYKDGKIKGSIVYIDKFGNLITDIPAKWVNFGKGKIVLKEFEIKNWVFSYSEIKENEFGILMGSNFTIEIGKNKASAFEALKANFLDSVFYIP